MIFPEDLGPCILGGRIKQNTWMGCDFIEGGGVNCSAREEKKKKGWGVLVGYFYTTLNLEVERQNIII
jgi:hypothetical protein